MIDEKTCDNCGQQEIARCQSCKMIKNHICTSGVCRPLIEPSEWIPAPEEEDE
jgi:hypothetical protein